jgi:hypothetical protein
MKYQSKFPSKISELDIFEVDSDFYLDRVEEVYDKHIPLVKKYKDYKKVSAFDSETKHYKDHVLLNRPKHGHTKNGKGLTNYTHSVFYHTTKMSKINNFVISMGCPANCGYCKESSNSRSFTEMGIDVESEKIQFEYDGKIMEIYAKTHVKFFDIKRNVIVYGCIQIPIYYGFPVSKDSLRKLQDRSLFRVLPD